MRNINYNPGISDQAVRSVIHKIENACKLNKHLIFNITFDEMNIKKQVE